jgi:hypothetical protein
VGLWQPSIADHLQTRLTFLGNETENTETK